MPSTLESLQAALAHQQGGRRQEAGQIYQELLASDPRNADALHLMGMLDYEAGQFDSAAVWIARAIQVNPAFAPFHNNLGNVLYAAGRFREAIRCFEAASHIDPNCAPTHINLGNACQALGRTEEAVSHYLRGLEADPNSAEAYNNLGNALRLQGKWQEAAACLGRAIQLKPDYAAAFLNLGNVSRDRNQLANAALCFGEALRRDPNLVEAYNNLGAIFMQQERLDDADRCLTEALRRRPQYPEAHVNLAAVLYEQGRLQESAGCCRRALELRPDYAEAYQNLANALTQLEHLDEAISALKQALRVRPADADVHANLGNVLGLLGRWDESSACFQEALRLKPGCAEAHHGLGGVLLGEGSFLGARTCFETALELKPGLAEAHLSHGILLLLMGQFEAGWQEYEWRLKRKYPRPRKFAKPRWDGAPLAGRTILLHAEQGLGDTMQFVRYASLVQKSGGNVILECQPELISLLQTVPGIARFVPAGSALPDFDVHLPLLSLPGVLQTNLASIPAQIPNLKADPQLAGQWRRRLADYRSFNVGLVWAGSPKNSNNRRRSLPLTSFCPLLQIPGITFFSLQKGPALDQISSTPEVIDTDAELRDLNETAAFIQNLDLVISVDTAVAHLAGALGKPVWTLLPFSPDWRWLLDRNDSPWYPTMRLFRQPRPGHWEAVIRDVRRTLRLTLDSSTRGLEPIPCIGTQH